MSDSLDVTKFKFPKLKEVDIAFSTLDTDKDLLAEARKRGFLHGHTKENDLFSTLFFDGGSINLKKEIDEDFKKQALPYLRALMGSFRPKHEYKEAVCALLLSELVDIK